MTLLLIGGYLLGAVLMFVFLAREERKGEKPWEEVSPSGLAIGMLFFWWFVFALCILLGIVAWFDELIKNGGKK